MEVAYVIPVLFLSNSLGTPLLPKTVETQDFEMALSQAEDKDSLRKWYRLDADAQPPCYRLLPVASHIPGFKVPTSSLGINLIFKQFGSFRPWDFTATASSVAELHRLG